MKLGKTDTPKRAQGDMTPMIDVVFQLLVFFLFTFKIAPVEGEIGVNMPPFSMGSAVTEEPPDIQKVMIRLSAGSNGSLEQIRVEEAQLGNDLQALTDLLKNNFTGTVGASGTEVEVQIDADRMLRYYWVIRTTNAVMRAGIATINFVDPKEKPPK